MSERQIVDWHIHCYLPEHRSAEDREITARRNVRRESGDPDPARFREVVEEANLGQFIIVALPKSDGMDTPNEFIAACVADYPGRAVGFGSVDPRAADAADQFEQSITKLGLRGIKLSPTYQALDPRSPEYWQLYEIAVHHRVPVLMHCGGAYKGSLEWSDPSLLDKVALAFPDLKLIVAHFGQPYMEQTAILMRKNENVYADLSARYHRPWQLYNGVMIATEYLVTDRLLFGSDFPVLSPAEAIARFRGINDWGGGASMPKIPEEVIESIIYERPLSLLGIAPNADG